MLKFYKNIQTDFLRQIFLELFQFKTQSLFWDTQYTHGMVLKLNPILPGLLKTRWT